MKKKIFVLPLLALNLAGCAAVGSLSSEDPWTSLSNFISNESPLEESDSWSNWDPYNYDTQEQSDWEWGASYEQTFEQTEDPDNTNEENRFIDYSKYTVANLENYQAIGFGTLNESGDQKKNYVKKEASSNSGASERATMLSLGNGTRNIQYSIGAPFTLLGKTKTGKVESLAFTNGKRAKSDVHLEGYWDLGDDLALFRVTNPWNEASGEDSANRTYALYTSDESAFEGSYSDCWDETTGEYVRVASTYFLSKKTGKVYALGENLWNYAPKFNEDGAVYCRMRGTYANDYYKIYEEDECLKIERPFSSSIDFVGIDSYGNTLTSVGVIASDGSIHLLSSYLDGNPDTFFDFVTKTICAKDGEGKTYYLDENAEFVEGAAGLMRPFFVYDIFDENFENGWIPSFPGVDGSGATTWQEYLAYDGSFYSNVRYDNPRSWYPIVIQWVTYNKSSISNYEELLSSKFSSITREQLLMAVKSFFGGAENLYFDEDGCVVTADTNHDQKDSNFSPFSETLLGPVELNGRKHVYSYNSMPDMWANCYGVSDSVTKLWGEWQFSEHSYHCSGFASDPSFDTQRWNMLNNEGTAILRGSDIYYCKRHADFNGIYKISLLTMETKRLHAQDGYQETGLGVDEEGRLLIMGVDNSLSDFAAYLDENDQMTFDKPAVKEGGDSYTLYPLD